MLLIVDRCVHRFADGSCRVPHYHTLYTHPHGARGRLGKGRCTAERVCEGATHSDMLRERYVEREGATEKGEGGRA